MKNPVTDFLPTVKPIRQIILSTISIAYHNFFSFSIVLLNSHL